MLQQNPPVVNLGEGLTQVVLCNGHKTVVFVTAVAVYDFDSCLTCFLFIYAADLVVQAKSGTGKTCVFAVIALENVDITFISTQVC